jgi:hypothetical protein
MTKRGFFAFLDVVMCCQMYNFCDTTLSDHFKDTYDLSTEVISILFSVQDIAFLATCFIAPICAKRFNLVLCVVVAQYFQCFASYLIGPSQFFDIPEYVWITMIGFTISGLGSPFTCVPPYKELENSLEAYGDTKKFNPDEVQDVVSGLFNSAYAMGGITGPLYGGYVQRALGFRYTADI